MPSYPKQSGFTLVEALVYITISSVLLVVITSLGYNVFVNRQKAIAGEEIIENANFVFARMEYNIRKAKSVILPVSSGGELSLEMEDGDINPTRFYLDGATMFFAQGTGAGTAITTSAIEITDLNFIKLTNNETGISIKTSIEFSSSRAGTNSNLTTTFNLPR
jgi:type II secretory pathway pseudopilin PulG